MRLKQLLIFIILIYFTQNLVFAQQGELRNEQNKQDLAAMYYNKGLNFGKFGILDSALIYGQKAVELYETLYQIDSIKLANAYQSLGIINKINGRYKIALEYYNQAEQIYTIKNNKPLRAHIYANKANIYSIQEDYSRAKNYHLRAYNIYSNDTVKYRKNLAIAYNNLGNIYRKERKYNTAIDYYHKSLKFKSYPDHRTMGNLALTYKEIKDYNQAEYYYKKAIVIAISNYGENNIITSSRFLNYANYLSIKNSNKEALKYFRMSISIYQTNFGDKHPYLANAYNNFGDHYLRNNNLDSALYYFQQSLIASTIGFNNINIEANPDLSNTLSKTHILSALKNKANALYLKAKKTNNTNLYKNSLQTYDKAIEAINMIRSGYISEQSKLFLADNQFETYSNALEACYDLYKITKDDSYLEKAFDYNESGKASILKEAITNTQALNFGGIPDSLITKEKDIEKSLWNYEELIYEEKKKKVPDQIKLEYWNKYLFESKVKLEQHTKFLENNYSKYYNLKYNNKNIYLTDLQNKLNQDDAVIDFSINNDVIFTFLITNKKTSLLRHKIDNQFHSHLDTLIKSLSNNNFSYHGIEEFNEFQRSSNYIYKILIDPISDKINNKNLTIIPDGRLAYLPFETLISEIKHYDKINYKALPYLLKTHAISYSYSANYLFNDILKNRTAHKTLAAFAPTYNNIDSLDIQLMETRQEYRENLFPLKGIKIEAENIAELTDGDVFLDMNANEKKFKQVASNYDILHLAMHTIMNDENPMYSKIAFTQHNDTLEDGFLNTYELYNMQLNSRMAVLSSCNSGSGKLHRGEGVMSLARGFIYAGCPSLVMTLWSVEDKSGVSLMVNFYNYLKKGNTKSVALQKSKIEFLNNADQLKSHPYFWSGYVVIGNNDSLFSQKRNVLIGLSLILVLGFFIYIRVRKSN